jgi:hypothetical protein
VRIPGFVTHAEATLNGEAMDVAARLERGFLSLDRTWKAGDVLDLDLPLVPRRVESHPAVVSNRGRVSLARGPLVYCLEGTDHSVPVRSLFLPRDARIETIANGGDVFGGGGLLRAEAFAAASPDESGLYRDARPPTSHILTAVPYFAWDHREAGDMIVFIPESAGLAETPSAPSLAAAAIPSASHCFERDTVQALNDGLEPDRSGDHSIPRFTWWDRRGSLEWAELAFPSRVADSRADVYWFDDGGGCRLPESWRLLYRDPDGGEWIPVPGAQQFEAVSDRYQTVRFGETTTDALRIEARLRDGASAGLLEWRVEGTEQDAIEKRPRPTSTK